MKYFLQSEDRFIIEKQVEKIIAKVHEKNEDYEVITFSLTENSFIDIRSNILTISLFKNKRIFIINDAYFVTEEKIKYVDDYDKNLMEKLLEFDSKDIIIFTCVTNKISDRLKITKKVKEVCKYLKLDPPSLKVKRERLIEKLEKENINFTEEAVDYFMSKIPTNDMNIYTNEVKRIILLKKDFNIELIDELLSKYIVFDFFDMLNQFLEQDVESFIKSYKNYISANESAYSFLITISKNLSLIKNILFLKKQGINKKEISEILKENPYRVNIIDKNNKMELNKVIDMLKKVNNMIIKCSKGDYDQNIIPEFELVKMMILE